MVGRYGWGGVKPVSSPDGTQIVFVCNAGGTAPNP
jgi:hypothetical protein